MWQYTSSGSVSGISGNVDMNIAYYDYPSIIKAAGLNGFTADKPEEKKTVTISTDDLTEEQAAFIAEVLKNANVEVK